MPRSNSRSRSNGGRNNNPSGRNQYSSDWGVMEMARERPIAAAAAAAGAAAAGLFLWSRRAQISNQLSNLTDQIGDWSENMNWSSSSDDGTGGFASSGQSSSGGTRGMSETGGGNASLGRSSGGGGSTGSASGRGRAKSTPTVQQ